MVFNCEAKQHLFKQYNINIVKYKLNEKEFVSTFR